MLTGCNNVKNEEDYLVAFSDETKSQYGFKNQKGETIIPLGKYEMIYTDTLKTYAVVYKPMVGLIAIDKKENVLYTVYTYDNGPDYVEEGLFRIIKNDKIGYADFITGKIVIEPQFDCAHPFENGLAKVSTACKKITQEDHVMWESENWFYINKAGKRSEK